MSKPSIKKNYLYNTLYEILAIIAPLVTAPYVSRIFGADGVGIYSYTNAISWYFTMFAALGVRSYGQREIAQHRDDRHAASKLFWELELMCVSTTLLCLIAWIVLIIFSKNYSTYYAVLSMTILATAFDISWFWGGYEQYRFIVIRNSLIKIIGIVLLFTFVHKKSDLLLYVSLVAATGLLGNISMWSYLPKYLVRVEWKTLQFKHHYKETLVYFIPTVATSIYTVLDKAMIGWITHDDYENGYYEQATKIINICKTMVFSIITVMSSRMSFLFAKEAHSEIKQRMENTVNFVLLIAVPIAFGLVGVAKRFVPLFFGEGYEKTVIIIYVMAPLLVIIGLSNCLGSLYFTPSGQRARSNKAIVAGAAINLILNIGLIFILKSIGAAIASVVAELTITVMYLYMARDYFNIKCIPQCAWKRIISATVMLTVVMFIGNTIKPAIVCIIVQIVLGAAVYITFLLLLHDTFLFNQISKLFGRIRRSRNRKEE